MSNPPPPPPTTLRILQYNMFLRPAFVNNPGAGDFKDERLDSFIAHALPNYDLLILQEVFDGINITKCCCIAGRLKKKLILAAKVAGYCCHHSGPDPGFGQFLDGGLLILSRFPILDTATHAFLTVGAHGDQLSSKGWYVNPSFSSSIQHLLTLLLSLHALLDVNGAQLDVFAAHTQASYQYVASKDVERIQRGQVEELAEFIKECRGDRERALFGGDLNIDALQDSHTGSYTNLLAVMKSRSGLNVCRDLLMEGKEGTHPETSVKYRWDKETDKEIVRGSYLTREAEGADEEGIVRRAARFDYL